MEFNWFKERTINILPLNKQERKNLRNTSHVVEREPHGDNFKNEVIKLITEKYDIDPHSAKIAFETCMTFGYAVIQPLCQKYPSGVMIATDNYRQKIAIG